MTEHPLQSLSLSELFLKVEKGCLDLENSPIGSHEAEFQNQVQNFLQCLIFSKNICENQEIFSKNEELDDIPTYAFKYLLIPYYFGYLQSLVSTNRKQNLTEAVAHYRTFLKDLERLGLLHEEEKELIQGKVQDGNLRRSYLINRAKREVQTKKLIETLLKKREEKQKKVKGVVGREKEQEESEEEWEREYYKLILQNNARKAIKESELSMQELELLNFAPPPSPSDSTSSKPTPSPSAPSKYTNIHIPSRAAADELNSKLILSNNNYTPVSSSTTSINNRREELANEVFRPQWIQPTLTPEQAVDLDIKTGKIKISSNPTPQRNQEENSEDEDDDDDYDENKVYRDREMDDWKDTHPAGSGNRMGRG